MSLLGFNIARGRRLGKSTFVRFGLNEAVGTSFEDVWTVSTNLTYLTSASLLRLTSNAAADAIAGTGAQKVTIQYLDASFIQQEEELDLVASSTVDTSGTALRVVRAWVSQFGSGKANAADIDITAVTGGTAQGEIVLGENQTLMTHYTVPAGKTAYMMYLFASVGKGDDCQIQLIKKDATDANGGFRMAVRFPLYQNNYARESEVPLKFTEKMDLVIRAKSIGGGIQVGAGFDLIVVDN